MSSGIVISLGGIPDDKIGSEEDVLDELTVEQVHGGYAPVDGGFSLFRSDRRDPLASGEARTAASIPRLRDLIPERRGS